MRGEQHSWQQEGFAWEGRQGNLPPHFPADRRNKECGVGHAFLSRHTMLKGCCGTVPNAPFPPQDRFFNINQKS